MQKLVIGTRKSPLAMWQTNFVRGQLERKHPGIEIEIIPVVTAGDKSQDSLTPIPLIGGKGMFTAELEEALRSRRIDLAVHSLKDLPTVMDREFVIGAIPTRASPFDVLISRGGESLDKLPHCATIGTSSVRRAAQIKHIRPDIRTAMIRGNVDTRIAKLMHAEGEFDAIVLAAAGIDRLERTSIVTQILSADQMLPAPGQGAMGIQCRADDDTTRKLVSVLNDQRTEWEVTAERSFLHALGAGCNTPVGALGLVEDVAGDYVLTLTGCCLSPDGSSRAEYKASGAPERARQLGEACAKEAMDAGFEKLGSVIVK